VVQNAVPVTQLGTATSMNQFSRQMGSTVGVAIFGTLLVHNLSVELPRHLPLLPGMSAHQIDLSRAQSQAMNTDQIRVNVEQALAERDRIIERAYHGDASAMETILRDPRIPEEVKAPLRDGGVRAQVHQELVQRADRVAQALDRGEAGRLELLEDPGLAASLRQQLQSIPTRALHDGELSHNVGGLFRDSILSQEDAYVANQTNHALQAARAAMQRYGQKVIVETREGMKLAFSASITQMFSRALWIVVIGAFIILLIPELPLRSRVESNQ
jgi:hypothetical protein